MNCYEVKKGPKEKGNLVSRPSDLPLLAPAALQFGGLLQGWLRHLVLVAVLHGLLSSYHINAIMILDKIHV